MWLSERSVQCMRLPRGEEEEKQGRREGWERNLREPHPLKDGQRDRKQGKRQNV